MKLIIALALFAVAANTELVPRNIEIPVWRLNPRLTGAEWQQIIADQEFKPEVVANYKPGTEAQPESAGVTQIDSKIIGGENAASGQFPWQVSLTLDGSGLCGGSLISNTWVLTAAHCVKNVASFRVIMGSLTVSTGTAGSVSMTSTTHVIHESYSSITIANDIGLVRLPSAVTFSSTINAVRLPRTSQASNTFAGVDAVVSGWGKTSDTSGAAVNLKFVTLPIITNTACAQTYGSTIKSTNICASGANGKSTCNGDSGGPLVWQDTDGIYSEIGIVSFGSSAGCTLGYDVAFTRVTSYLSWISTNTGISIRP